MKAHTPVLRSPWYADPADGTVLHRYLDEEFVPRFLQDARTGRLTRNADQAWRAQDRFGARQDYPSLRLPIHRAFYIASCEVSCDSFGLPALDPAHILSAGLVVRRGRSPTQAQRWIVKQGVAMGWWGGEASQAEPCDCRRLRQAGLLPESYPQPAYSGEETSPMHALSLRAGDANDVQRNRTLLWGYVPLGGQVRVDGAPSASNPDPSQPDYAKESLWPIGTAENTQAPWQWAHGYQVRGGQAEPAFGQLLSLLLGRYRLDDASNPDNSALRSLLDGIHFHAAPLQVRRSRTGFGSGQGLATSMDETHLLLHNYSAIEAADLNNAGDPVLNPDTQQISLLAYLDQHAEQLLEWLSWQQRGELRALPDYVQPPEEEILLARPPWSLYLSERQAEHLRALLDLRARAAVVSSDAGTAVPRFGQDQDDVFFVMPFLRYRDAEGCERIAWGPASQPFRVVSPLSPQAQRPTLIALPELADLKRGGPRGLTFVAPKSLADKILKLKMNLDLDQGGPGNPGGSCYGFSFSLPVITLVALILLMIMINLLNIIFWWLPYAFLALPRLCLRALAKSSGGGA